MARAMISPLPFALVIVVPLIFVIYRIRRVNERSRPDVVILQRTRKVDVEMSAIVAIVLLHDRFLTGGQRTAEFSALCKMSAYHSREPAAPLLVPWGHATANEHGACSTERTV